MCRSEDKMTSNKNISTIVLQSHSKIQSCLQTITYYYILIICWQGRGFYLLSLDKDGGDRSIGRKANNKYEDKVSTGQVVHLRGKLVRVCVRRCPRTALLHHKLRELTGRTSVFIQKQIRGNCCCSNTARTTSLVFLKFISWNKFFCCMKK